jgi:hypothetical protein
MNCFGHNDELQGSIEPAIFCLGERLLVSEAKLWFLFVGVKFNLCEGVDG